MFPGFGKVGVRSGQQEAYAKVICQDLTNYMNSKLAHAFT